VKKTTFLDERKRFYDFGRDGRRIVKVFSTPATQGAPPLPELFISIIRAYSHYPKHPVAIKIKPNHNTI
jgi:hypothetical protein